MLRSFVLADLLTLGNAACGTGALFACLRYVEHGERGFVWMAIGLLPVALALDVADGTVARWRTRRYGSAGTLGADLDSLADVVSFGVAPAMLGYALGLRGGWDVVVLVYFVCCGIARLARYNATHDALSDASGKVAYYEGTPIPTSLVLVAAMAVWVVGLVAVLALTGVPCAGSLWVGVH
ncbi:MAG: CDP-alcohol phosphatidyltransferase family protein, partial [Myxococcota bacterium]